LTGGEKGERLREKGQRSFLSPFPLNLLPEQGSELPVKSEIAEWHLVKPSFE
jgi:hypothetical protein